MLLRATRELRYAGRSVCAGQTFEASERDAIVLQAAKRAEKAEVLNRTDLPKPAEPMPAPADDRDELRAEYQTITGKKPFPGWDAAEIRRRMAMAAEGKGEPRTGEYLRRDMRAEE